MLQAIRDRAQGWIAWAIVILISIPFALWGIQEYMGVGAQPVVAKVNDREITERELDQRYHQFRQQLRERLGAAYRPELFDDEQLRRQVLEDMIRQELILQESAELGLFAGDQLVRSMILGLPQFRTDGQFDPAAYDQALRFQGLTSAGFEQRVRRSLVSNQLSKALEVSAFVTERELAETVRLRNQRRRIGYFILPVADFLGSEEIAESDVKAYYDAHPERFGVPEQVKVEYLELDADRIGAMVTPDEETLRGFYAAQGEQFGQGEQRRASHVLVAVAPDADDAATKAAERKLADSLARIDGGEAFSLVAEEVSEDPGSAQSGGDLGFFERGIMDPAFEDAAFGATVNEVVGPIRSRFGFHLIKVTEIKGGNIPSFEEKRDDVLELFRRNEGERLFYDYAERLSDLSYENSDSLEPAAAALGIDTKVSDWLGRQGGGGVLGVPKIVAAAFSEDVLTQGNNSEALELSPEHVVVLRVYDHKEATIKPLEEVGDEIVEILRRDGAAAKVGEKGETLVQRLKGGETLQQIADATGYQLNQPDAVRRSGSNLPPELVSMVFRLSRPSEDEPTFGMVVLNNNDVAVMELQGVTDGVVTDLDAAALQNEKKALQRVQGRSDFEHLVQHLRKEAEVNIR